MTYCSDQDSLYHELATAHGGAMVRLACVSEANADKRHDLVQTMHVELWKSLKQFDGRCSKKTWVYRVIHNVAALHMRKEARHKLSSLDIENLDISCPSDTQRASERQDALERLHIWIRRLDMPDRQILTLYLEDIKSAEIAQMTGLSIGAVTTRISRLKSKLTVHYKETEHDQA